MMSGRLRGTAVRVLRSSAAAGLASLLAVAAFAFQAPELAMAAGRGCVLPGTDGPNPSLTGIVNTYYPATASATSGATSISVGAPIPGGSPAVAAGDLLLVIQMQDADINSANAIAYGDGATGRGSTGVRSTGLYEYVAATSAAGATVNIAGTGAGGGLVNSYDFSTAVTATNGFRTFQVIRVPQYSSATVAAGLTAAAWDGATHAGGILAIDVAGALNLGGQTISVNQLGFKGGLGVLQAGPLNGDTGTDYVVASQRGHHGYKAEGIGGTPHFLYNALANAAVVSAADGYPGGDAARGAPGNAAGGGTDANPTINDQNSGGGGGANGGQGGLGGNSWNTNQPVGGLGGAAFPAAAARVVLGGGGGAGSRNNSAAIPNASSGGTGGGIVMIRTGSLVGAGSITANGGVGVTPANDGGGGGGAGGSVVISTSSGTVNGLTIAANGGAGTDAWPAGTAGTANRHGPGGGGSGGVIITSPAILPPQASVAGGVHGLTTNGPDPYGSTSGAAGVVLTTTLGTIPGSSSGAECLPVLTVTKTTSTPNVTNTSSGTTANYSITVRNAAGASRATSVNISDALPAGFTYTTTVGIVLNGGATRPATVNPVSGATNPTFGTFTIPAAASVVITFRVHIAAAVRPGRYSNPATASYLSPTRTTSAGTTSAAYAGGGAERVAINSLAGLPNTSGLRAGADTVGPIAPETSSSLWLTLLGVFAGIGALGMAMRMVLDNRTRYRQRRRRPASGALPVVLCIFVCTLALSPLVLHPTTGTISTSAEAVAGPVLIGDTFVSQSRPAPAVEERFHTAAGPIIPSRLRIPSIALDAPVAGVGLLPDGSMGVPDNLWTSGWLSSSARPGHAGSAVIAGHRGIGTPALFSHLENVRPGDKIHVSDAGGGELVYEVIRVASLDLSVTTQLQVFGPTAQQQLVLITCFGEYSRITRTYDHRLVVFSRLLPPN